MSQDLYPFSVALIYHQHLVLMMGESDPCENLLQHILRILSGVQVWTLWGPTHVGNDVSCSLNHSFTIWAWWIQALSYWNVLVPSGKKKSIDGIIWSLSIFRWSADLILWAHNVAEPPPDRLQQPQIIALLPQARTVGTRHDGESLHPPLFLPWCSQHSGTE